MKELRFSYNWNNKLNCKAFTTIRLSESYKPGEEYKIVLMPKGKNPEVKGVAKIIEIKKFFLDQINEFISQLDTGYSKYGCVDIIKRMYPSADWTKQKLSLILFKYNG